MGKDYSTLKVEAEMNVEGQNWDDSMFIAIPSGPGDCGHTPCNQYQYQVAVHPPKHYPQHFHEFFKMADELTMLGIDSFTERISLGPPYSNCTNEWPKNATRIAREEPERDMVPELMNNYTMNECIISFVRDDVRCPAQCHKQEYLVGRKWDIRLQSDAIGKVFELDHPPTEYTFLEIVFTQLKHVVIEEKALCPILTFLGNVGGLAGLCMGISLVSVVEVIETVIVLVICFWQRIFRKSSKLGQRTTIASGV